MNFKSIVLAITFATLPVHFCDAQQSPPKNREILEKSVKIISRNTTEFTDKTREAGDMLIQLYEDQNKGKWEDPIVEDVDVYSLAMKNHNYLVDNNLLLVKADGTVDYKELKVDDGKRINVYSVYQYALLQKMEPEAQKKAFKNGKFNLAFLWKPAPGKKPTN